MLWILIAFAIVVSFFSIQEIYADESSNSDWCQVGEFRIGDMFSHWWIIIDGLESDLCVLRIHFSGEGHISDYYCKIPPTKLGTIEDLPMLIHSEEKNDYCLTIFDGFVGIDEINYSPKKQAELGIPPQYVWCDIGLKLILKATNGSPACVKPETKIKLIERGWASS